MDDIYGAAFNYLPPETTLHDVLGTNAKLDFMIFWLLAVFFLSLALFLSHHAP